MFTYVCIPPFAAFVFSTLALLFSAVLYLK